MGCHSCCRRRCKMMAENGREETEGHEDFQCGELIREGADGEEMDKLECAVCLQGCVHPVELPCGHIFCFLCVKGVANQSKRCAMCRKELPSGYLERPHLVNTSDLERPRAYEDGQQWFYEGHNGWWQYDERTSSELEMAYKRHERTCELLIAGFLYVVDFECMIQLRRNDPSRRRRIKRDLATIPKKGIAGLRLPEAVSEDMEPIQSANRDDSGAEGGEEVITAPSTSAASLQVLPGLRFPFLATAQRNKSPSPVPTAPNNTPQTPHTPSQDSGTSSPTAPCDPSIHRIVRDMESLLLESIETEDGSADDGTDVEPGSRSPILWSPSNSDDEIL